MTALRTGNLPALRQGEHAATTFVGHNSTNDLPGSDPTPGLTFAGMLVNAWTIE
jgi:hypothetical protein